jgi:hypothetical protein
VNRRERLADLRVVLADTWDRHGPGAGWRRMDAINDEVVILNRKIEFLVKTLEGVVKDEPAPGGKPLAAIKGAGYRSAPRRPGLHLVPEAER